MLLNSLTGEVGKLALTFGLPLRELITELDEDFGIIADLDTLRREFYSMKKGTHETVSQFAGRVGYQLMELQTTFPGAIPQCDEEEIKKGRLYSSLKLHLKWVEDLDHCSQKGVEEYHNNWQVEEQLHHLVVMVMVIVMVLEEVVDHLPKGKWQ